MAGRPGEDTEARMKRAIFQVANTLHISPEILYQRIEVLTRSTFTVGLPWAPTPGRLRRLLGDLDAFAELLTQWQSRDVTAAAEVGRFGAAVALHTTTLARVTMGESDVLIRNVLSIMRNWERDAKIISAQMSRLAWLLDGWSYIVALWTSVENEPHERQRDTIPGNGPADPGHAQGNLGMDRERAGTGIEIHSAKMGPSEPGLANGQEPARHGRPERGVEGGHAMTTWAELQQLSVAIAQASDEKLIQIVRIVDTLPERTQLDEAIAKVRHRLSW